MALNQKLMLKNLKCINKVRNFKKFIKKYEISMTRNNVEEAIFIGKQF